MKTGHSRFGAVTIVFVLICVSPLAAQFRNNSDPGILGPGTPGRHRGAVTAIARDRDGRIVSAGEDGFVEIWNNQSALERYQLSPYGIKSMVLSPEKPQIAVIESDGFESCRVSAWDYKHKKNLFTLSFQDSVSYINYSAAGSFLIAVRNKRRKLSLSDILCKWNR